MKTLWRALTGAVRAAGFALQLRHLNRRDEALRALARLQRPAH